MIFGKPIGKVEKYLGDLVEKQGACLFSLIDPDKLSGHAGAKVAKESYEAGADVILVGGSIGAQGTILDETVKMIKESVKVPVVLFPGNISGLTPFADATYFMHMLNSRDVYWLSTAQIQGAPTVQRMGIEAIPTGYLVLEPGRAVGWIGNANLIPRDRPDLAYACALAAKLMGAHVIVSDSGSGAAEPAPIELVAGIAKACKNEVFYSYAGGVKNGEQAGDVIKAGAHAIQIGTAFEAGDVKEKTKKMKAAILQAAKKRV
ncbi:MAG TPA: geranylgeranylglyceryl/heptaprenylglyceryl phosphate synthase [Candidatus Norongarragalinales archaeon]|jgi:phosphoglycerol geranylgeranyltransferase|nr:geranylgeranylglyceryl/heptaprenylglyceryl phosphate synthase [Candidatus Norongarragalinales archaeon]